MPTPMSADDNKKDKKPKDTRFKQQKLPAWQPIMTAGTVLPAFFAIGVAFIPLGVALLVTSDSVQEVSVDYTGENCVPLGAVGENYTTCAGYLEDNPEPSVPCQCEVTITLPKPFKGNVYMYYGLTNYYQNHRRYVKSRDNNQLKGVTINSPSDLSGNCNPYLEDENKNYYAPCGAIANSLFNDTFSLRWEGDDSHAAQDVDLTSSGIAWETDVNSKFNNPKSFDGSVHPENWAVNVTELGSGTDHYGYKSEDLIVWMRTAALPTFRKLHRRVVHSGTFSEGLRAGNYTVMITYQYPVVAFDGSKRLILTTTSWMGGKNPFLGIAYLVVGSICIVLGIVFVIIHVRVGKNPSEMSANVNSNTHY